MTDDFLVVDMDMAQVPKSEDSRVATEELKNFISSLNLSDDDRIFLLGLIMERMQEAEYDGFVHGLCIGGKQHDN